MTDPNAAAVDAALAAFLGRPFPGFSSEDGAAHYRSRMELALAAYRSCEPVRPRRLEAAVEGCSECGGARWKLAFVEGMTPFVGGPPTVGGWESVPCSTCNPDGLLPRVKEFPRD